MRRNATKIAAVALSLAVTMTSVNIPTTAAAAKKVKLNKTKASIKVGKSTTLKVTKGGKAVKATFTSSNKKIAALGPKKNKNKVTAKSVKVTGKKKGSAKITAKYGKKKFTCKITVKKAPSPTKAPTPTDAPAPTDAPVTPTDAPSTTDTPTTAPDTVGAITSFKATAADTLTAVLDSAVPADAVVEITKNDVKQEGDVTYNEARTEVTFKGKAELQTGEYVITITKGDSKAEAKTTVEEKKVTTINIISPTALTGDSTGSETSCDNKVAYIYYEVLDQYGGDMTASSDIRWTISSSKLVNVDTSKGRITVQSTGDAFVYGTQLYIVGVYASTGATCNTSIPIGMQQAIDKVSVAGFINDKVDKSKIEVGLPKNFAPNTWYMVYETFDQNGMPLDTKGYDSKDITFTSNNPLLVESDFNCADKRIYAVGEKQYAAVLVKPGEYADKGGEVTITAISNKTGHREEYNYVVGNNGLLKSLVLGTPSGVVADLDTVEIPYTATDTDGKEIKNYETIVRSSNALSLSASTGTLTVYEKADGTAGIRWADDTDDELKKSGYKDARTFDNVERIVSLTTVVVGGESTTKLMNVKDRRRPVAFDTIKFGPDENDALVIGNNTTLDLLTDKVTYLDQYGAVMKGDVAKNFFTTAFDSFNNEKYLLRVKAAKENDLSLEPATGAAIVDGDDANAKINKMLESSVDTSGNYDKKLNNVDNAKIYFDAKDHTAINGKKGDLETNKSIGSVAVTYSIATVNAETGVSNRGKTKTVTYSVVPQSAVIGNVELTANSSKYFAETENTVNANGSDLKDSIKGYVATGSAIKLQAGDLGFKVKGKTNSGLSCTLPSSMYNVSEDTEIKLSGNAIDSVVANVLKWNELYNENDAKCTRIDAQKTLKLDVKTTWNGVEDKDQEKAVVSRTIKLSDAGRVPATVVNFKVSATPDKTKIVNGGTGTDVNNSNRYVYEKVIDQYGITIDPSLYEMSYSVSNQVEKKNSDSEFVHLENSFTIEKNGTSELVISGVEIGDTFKVTATAISKANKNITATASVDVTAGADRRAYISSSATDGDSDKNWRKDTIANGGLGMKR